MEIKDIFGGFSAFGFSGSRLSGGFPSRACARACGLVPAGSAVFVGCARGVDSVARSAFPSASVFRASSFSARSFAGRLALRSSACVSAVVSAGGLWCSFPSGACPSGLLPSGSPFSGAGSGSWASLALAVFQGSACFVCLPSGVSVPSWFAGFGFVPVGRGCFFRPAVPPVPSLF